MTLKNSVLRLAAIAATAALAIPAQAMQADATQVRIYQKNATASFVELGAMDGAPGNAHAGYLEFYQSSDGSMAVYGYVFHYTCAAGFTFDPTNEYGDAYDQLETDCTFLDPGSESYETGELDISMSGDQGRAHVVGYYDSSLAGQPTVAFDLRFAGFGEITEANTVNRGPGYKQLVRERSRAATVKGTVGGMRIGDNDGLPQFAGQVERVRFKTFTW